MRQKDTKIMEVSVCWFCWIVFRQYCTLWVSFSKMIVSKSKFFEVMSWEHWHLTWKKGKSKSSERLKTDDQLQQMGKAKYALSWGSNEYSRELCRWLKSCWYWRERFCAILHVIPQVTPILRGKVILRLFAGRNDIA